MKVNPVRYKNINVKVKGRIVPLEKDSNFSAVLNEDGIVFFAGEYQSDFYSIPIKNFAFFDIIKVDNKSKIKLLKGDEHIHISFPDNYKIENVFNEFKQYQTEIMDLYREKISKNDIVISDVVTIKQDKQAKYILTISKKHDLNVLYLTDNLDPVDFDPLKALDACFYTSKDDTIRLFYINENNNLMFYDDNTRKSIEFPDTAEFAKCLKVNSTMYSDQIAYVSKDGAIVVYDIIFGIIPELLISRKYELIDHEEGKRESFELFDFTIEQQIVAVTKKYLYRYSLDSNDPNLVKQISDTDDNILAFAVSPSSSNKSLILIDNGYLCYFTGEEFVAIKHGIQKPELISYTPYGSGFIISDDKGDFYEWTEVSPGRWISVE